MFNIGDEVCIKKGKTISVGGPRFKEWLAKHRLLGTIFIVDGKDYLMNEVYHRVKGSDYVIHVDDLVKPLLTLGNV